MRAFHTVGESHNTSRRNGFAALRAHPNGHHSPRESTQRYRNGLRRKSAESRGQREFHAPAHGIDTFGADAHTIAELPDARVVTAAGDNGMISFAV